MNWPERVWIYSPVRVLLQGAEDCRVAPTGGSADEVESALRDRLRPGKRGARLLVGDRMGFKRVVAFDLEHRLVRRAARAPTVCAYDGERLPITWAMQKNFPFQDSTFDAVVNFGIIHHVLDWRRCIREIGKGGQTRRGFSILKKIYPPLYANFLLETHASPSHRGPLLRTRIPGSV